MGTECKRKIYSFAHFSSLKLLYRAFSTDSIQRMWNCLELLCVSSCFRCGWNVIRHVSKRAPHSKVLNLLKRIKKNKNRHFRLITILGMLPIKYSRLSGEALPCVCLWTLHYTYISSLDTFKSLLQIPIHVRKENFDKGNQKGNFFSVQRGRFCEETTLKGKSFAGKKFWFFLRIREMGFGKEQKPNMIL